MKVATLENKAKETLNGKKEEIAVERLIRFEDQIIEMEAALVLLKQKKAEFMETEIDDVKLHNFTY
jgi:hypothetical protein